MRVVKPDSPDSPVTIDVPISKDNVIFGVRPVDAKGHRSLVVVPQSAWPRPNDTGRKTV